MFTAPVTWKRSLLVAAIVSYLPFVVCALAIDVRDLPSIDWSATGRSGMAKSDLLLQHVLCGVGPSLAPFSLISRIANVDSRFFIVMAIPMTAALLVGVASLGRWGREWLVGGAVLAFVIHSVAAYHLFTGSIW